MVDVLHMLIRNRIKKLLTIALSEAERGLNGEREWG
jgi:hypothetical protein